MMLDNLTRWPLRIGILGAVVSANVAGDCGYVRPTYVGSGGAAVTAPQPQPPVYCDRDTAQTTVAASAGRGVIFNPGDANQLKLVSAERNWVRERFGWGLGLIGYQGRYTTSAAYFNNSEAFRYQGLGGQVHSYLHMKQGRVEVRPLSAQLSILREWGEWADLRAQMPFEVNRPDGIAKLQQVSGLKAHGIFRMGGEILSLPRRRWALQVGGGIYGVITHGNLGLGTQAMAASGPIRINASVLALGSTPYAFQMGLAVGLPPYRKR